MKTTLLEIFYVLAGIVLITAAFFAVKDKKNPHRLETGLFWLLAGFIFIVGKHIPSWIVGLVILLMGALTALKRVALGFLAPSDEGFRQKSAIAIGGKIFIPALAIGIIAFTVAQGIPKLGGIVGLGLGALTAAVITLFVTKTHPKNFGYDSSRLLLQMGAIAILPQLLATLGALFAKAGVGTVISERIGNFVQQGDVLIGVIAYCLGMAIFTIIMGNAFAAFAVITAGIGVPFVYSEGANPAIASSLALTAGYCGTLMTPMAANFNIVPAAILQTKNQYRVIITQMPVAIALLLTHIVLMYYWAF